MRKISTFGDRLAFGCVVCLLGCGTAAISSASSCSASQQKAVVKHVLEVGPGECVTVAKIYENGEVEELCADLQQLSELAPLVGVRAMPSALPGASPKALPSCRPTPSVAPALGDRK